MSKDEDGANISRRSFLEKLLGGAAVVATVGTSLIMTACKKDKDEDIAPRGIQKNDNPSVTAAYDSVYYGFLDNPFWNGSTNDGHSAEKRQDIRNDLNGYPGISIIEPGHVKPAAIVDAQGREIPSKDRDYSVKNAIPYVSITGINMDAVRNPNNIDQDIKDLAKLMDSIGGWLQKPAAKGGGIQTWQSDSIQMVDLRKPDVAAAMFEFMKKKAKQYPRGLKLDDIDSASYLELITKKPELVDKSNTFFYFDPKKADDTYKNHFNGYTDAMLKLMKDIGNKVHEEDSNAVDINGAPLKKFVVVNGGFNPHPDGSNKVFETIAAIPDVQIEKETAVNIQKVVNGKKTIERLDAGSQDWINGRIYGLGRNGQKLLDDKGNDFYPDGANTLVAAFKKAGKNSVHFIGYEPALLEGNNTVGNLTPGVMAGYRDIVDRVHKATGFGLKVSVFSGGREINDEKFLKLNADQRSLYKSGRLAFGGGELPQSETTVYGDGKPAPFKMNYIGPRRGGAGLDTQSIDSVLNGGRGR